MTPFLVFKLAVTAIFAGAVAFLLGEWNSRSRYGMTDWWEGLSIFGGFAFTVGVLFVLVSGLWALWRI
jgi:hypothetical protein